MDNVDSEVDETSFFLKNALVEVGKSFFGSPYASEFAMIGLLCEGHILIEDLPGVGKTTLAKALAQAIHLNWNRIQGTSDLLPSDVTGSLVALNKDLVFREGPIFSNIVLFDELNRASPRAQSALLEAMEERSVTVDGVTRSLPNPFFVIATQNPKDIDGTFPLPQNQLDRFIMRLTIGYPDRFSENRILRETATQVELQPRTVDMDDLSNKNVNDGFFGALIKRVSSIFVADSIFEYVLDLVNMSRQSADFAIGVSPRAGVSLVKAARARALIHERDYVIPDDIKVLIKPVLSHRVKISQNARLSGINTDDVLNAIASMVPLPNG